MDHQDQGVTPLKLMGATEQISYISIPSTLAIILSGSISSICIRHAICRCTTRCRGLASDVRVEMSLVMLMSHSRNVIKIRCGTSRSVLGGFLHFRHPSHHPTVFYWRRTSDGIFTSTYFCEHPSFWVSYPRVNMYW